GHPGIHRGFLESDRGRGHRRGRRIALDLQGQEGRLMSTQWLLMLLVAGLYGYDSSILLYCNEALLVPRRGGKWTVKLGWDKARILGKDLVLAGLAAPHRPMFRLAWQFDGRSSASNDPGWTAWRQRLAPLGPWAAGLAVGLFVVLPATLF